MGLRNSLGGGCCCWGCADFERECKENFHLCLPFPPMARGCCEKKKEVLLF
jgi:hypothetical protein